MKGWQALGSNPTHHHCGDKEASIVYGLLLLIGIAVNADLGLVDLILLVVAWRALSRNAR